MHANASAGAFGTSRQALHMDKRDAFRGGWHRPAMVAGLEVLNSGTFEESGAFHCVQKV